MLISNKVHVNCISFIILQFEIKIRQNSFFVKCKGIYINLIVKNVKTLRKSLPINPISLNGIPVVI